MTYENALRALTLASVVPVVGAAAGVVPTSYAMLALSSAMEYAPEPEEVNSTEETAPTNSTSPGKTQEQDERPSGQNIPSQPK